MRPAFTYFENEYIKVEQIFSHIDNTDRHTAYTD